MDRPKEEQHFLPKEPLELPEHASPVNEEQEDQEYESDYAIRTLLSWSAPGRPFQKKGKEFFLNILIITLLLEVILFLFAQYALMALILSLVFLAYVLNTVPPHNFHYKVTSEGIMVEDHFFLWQELYDFYFRRQNGEDALIVGTKAFFPGELTIVLGDMHRDHMRDILLPFLPYREYVKPTFLEKSGHWLEKNFPLDRQHPQKKA